MPDLTAVRPAEPHAEVKARLAAAVEAARDEIIDLSHRIHADPEPAFEEHHAAAWVAEVLRAPRLRGRASGGQPGDGDPGDPPRRPRRRRPADRHPRRVRRAAGARPRLRPQHDGRVGRRGGDRPGRRSPTSCPARSSSSARPAEERGSGKQIMIEDGLFDGLDAALLYHPCDRDHVESYPLASEDVDVVFTGLQAHASSDPWKGRNALDAMILLFSSVGLWRQQLAADARASTGSSARAARRPTSSRTGPSAWFMLRSDDQAVLRGDEARSSRRCARPPPLATGTTVEVTFSGGATTMNNNRGPGRALPGQHGRLRHRRHGRRPERRQHRHGQRQLGLPDDPPRPRHLRRGRARPLDRCSATPPPRPRADETTLLAATLVAQTAVDLFLDPALVEAAWAAFRDD